MRIVGRGKLDAFCASYPDSRAWIEAWLHETEGATWATPQDVRNRFATASFLAGNVVCFNVRGNNYRMEVRVSYHTASVSILAQSAEIDR